MKKIEEIIITPYAVRVNPEVKKYLKKEKLQGEVRKAIYSLVTAHKAAQQQEGASL